MTSKVPSRESGGYAFRRLARQPDAAKPKAGILLFQAFFPFDPLEKFPEYRAMNSPKPARLFALLVAASFPAGLAGFLLPRRFL